MTLLLDWWPVLAGILGVWIRVEVGQASNKTEIKNIKEGIREDTEHVEDMLKELRNDIKNIE